MSATTSDVDEADRLARVKLSCTIEPGDLRVTGLVSELGASKVHGYLEAAGEVEPHWAFSIGRELAHVDASRVLEQAESRGIRFVTPADAEWPNRLGALSDAGALHDRGGEPVGLWVRGEGDLRQVAANAVAVVGSRAATSYGMEQASDLSRELTSMGQTIVSGLAFGVDQAAHRGALAAGGPTIAVMPPAESTAPTRPRTRNCSRPSRSAAWSSQRPRPARTPTRTRFLIRTTQAGLRPRPERRSATRCASRSRSEAGRARPAHRAGRAVAASARA
jgi:DNA processing protein